MGSQIVNHSGRAIVAFLDFENYFNAIGLECLFEILEKFGMAKEDIGVLRQYYEHSYFQVVQESGEATARIRLQRGLRQGCPLSPILGGVVVNALIRWLESEGGGSRNSSGEEYHTLLFADDSTLLTESTKAMQKLLGTVERFSDKSELTEIRDIGIRLQEPKTDMGQGPNER